MNHTEKLIETLLPNMIIEKGEETTNEKGIKYRYDHYKNKYKTTPFWLAQMFYKAAKENGKEYSRQFHYNNEYSFYFNRAKYKGEQDEEITFSKLIIIG